MKTSHVSKARVILKLNPETQFGKIGKELTHVAGVFSYEINYVNDSIKVEYDPLKTSMNEIQRIVHK
jgi:copper chaperone CopZ